MVQLEQLMVQVTTRKWFVLKIISKSVLLIKEKQLFEKARHAENIGPMSSITVRFFEKFMKINSPPICLFHYKYGIEPEILCSSSFSENHL